MSAVFIAFLILLIDQSTKALILENFQPGESFPLIKDIFHISLVCNKGIAFGVFSKNTNFPFIWISILCTLALVLIFTFYKRFLFKKKSTQFYIFFILAGAIGNLIDRVRFGYVVDFLDFRIWPVFNISDLSITIGTALLFLQMFRQKKSI